MTHMGITAMEKFLGREVPLLAAINTPLMDGDIKRSGDPAYAGAYY